MHVKIGPCRVASLNLKRRCISVELHLPDWFKELPFDEDAMEEAVLDKKIQNVLGIMGWDLNRANNAQTLDAFFEF